MSVGSLQTVLVQLQTTRHRHTYRRGTRPQHHLRTVVLMVARCTTVNSNGSLKQTLVIIRQIEDSSLMSVVLSLLQCLAMAIVNPLEVYESLTSLILKHRIMTLKPALVQAQLALSR